MVIIKCVLVLSLILGSFSLQGFSCSSSKIKSISALSSNDSVIITANADIKSSNSLINSYSRQLERHPYRTKMLSSAFVGGVGDFLIQTLQKKLGVIDMRRWLVFTSVAGFYIAPAIHLWFNWLATLPFPSKYGKDKVALIQLFLDQTLGAVIINGGFFYAFELAQALFPPYPVLATNFLVAGTNAIKRNMWPTLVANW